VTGRDVAERELALRFAPDTGTWELLGDASEYGLGKTRKAILAAIEAHRELTPKAVSDLLENVSHDLAKKTMQRMFSDGQLAADAGKYSICPPVPAVPESPSEGQGDSGDSGYENGLDDGWENVDDDERARRFDVMYPRRSS
jgi:hypothetical protein